MLRRLNLPNLKSGILFPLFLTGMTGICLLSCQAPDITKEISPTADAQLIHELLMNQENDWNEGDIEAFMAAYLNSDSLRFASGNSYRFGWQNTLDRYHTTYPDRDAMGTLTFSDLDIDILSAEWAMAFGAWHLERAGEYEDIGGLFTLVLQRTGGGWRIKYDHTSSAL